MERDSITTDTCELISTVDTVDCTSLVEQHAVHTHVTLHNKYEFYSATSRLYACYTGID